MTQLEFDNEWSRAVEKFNQSAGARFRRQNILQALQPETGQVILDVGSGPGHQVFEISLAVGEQGRVFGIDPAKDGIEIAQQRCRDAKNVEFRLGSVFDLPFEDATLDAAMSSQVFEYLDDVRGALQEMRRVLKPGGRILIHDTDWGSLLWHSSDAHRMKKILKSWDAHLANPHLPQTLGTQLHNTGFIDIQVEPVVHVETGFEPNSMSDILITFIAGYVTTQGVPQTEAEAWADDLRSLDKSNYFFSSNEYIFTATRA